MAVVVEFGVVIGFILRLIAFAQFVGDPGNLWPLVLLFSVLYSTPVVLAGAIAGAAVRWWQDRAVRRNA